MTDPDDENFAIFGEALEPLDEDNLPKKKPITLEDQYALDAQGRRRFHGAFTGGFSAGYFNSVGTRDGWKPQQFKSSRSSKAGGFAQRPEDFMDDEDTGQFGIAPSVIRATSDFSSGSQNKGRKRERPVDHDGPIPGTPVLQNLLKPIKDTIGITLLKKMGWRPGQGVGPRLTKQEKRKVAKRHQKKKIYGCEIPGREQQLEESESESEDESILFAPDDYEPFRCNPKDNYFGIGYSGLDRRPVLTSNINLFDAPTLKISGAKQNLSIRGQAFGVGAFEADDEDIYARDDMTRYDFTLGPEKKKKTRWLNDEKSTKNDCLEGFLRGKNPLENKKHYEAPALPKDYKPIHVVKKSRFAPVEITPLRSDKHKGLARHDLNAEVRAKILNDDNNKKITSNDNVKKINDLGECSWMKKLNSKSFIQGGVENLSNTNSSGSLIKFNEFKTSCLLSNNSGNSKETLNFQTNINDSNDLDIIKMKKPFILDADKQKRFEQYVDLLKNSNDDNNVIKLNNIQPLSMTEWEREHEREEFALAAKLFDNDNKAQIAENVKVNKTFVSEMVVVEENFTPERQMINAAKAKMFGKLTRIVEIWQPANILCKRFNIPEPVSGCTTAIDIKKSNKKYSLFESLDFTEAKTFEKSNQSTGETCELSSTSTSTSTSLINKDVSIDKTNDKLNEKVSSFETSYEKVFKRKNDLDIIKINSSTTSSVESLNKLNSFKKRDNNVDDDIDKNDCNLDKTVSLSFNNEQIVGNNINEKKDLFKAIFLSSSEESESEDEVDRSGVKGDEQKDNLDSETVKTVLIGKPASELNVQRNTSPPRGIFAKLDFDNLLMPSNSDSTLLKKNQDSINSKLNKTQIETLNKKEQQQLDDEEKNKKTLQQTATNHLNQFNQKISTSVIESQDNNLTDMYGPVLPNNSIKNSTPEDSSSVQKHIFSAVVPKVMSSNINDKMSMKWVEKVKSKKSKKDKKHKHKDKHKHKHKKKKH